MNGRDELIEQPEDAVGPIRAGKRLKLCLAASGGGHVRQLLDLETVWRPHDSFFITEETVMGRSLSDKHRTYFVPHFAWGQTKLGAPLRMLVSAAVSLARSARVLWRERPDIVITTGAGAVFPAVLLARLLGAKIVLIETFARFDRPSLFARLAAPLAHRKIVQSEGLAGFWRNAQTFDPLKILDGPRPEKKPLMFVTVGATLPFDRLIQSVANLKQRGLIPERVIAQVGIGGARPEGIETVETLPFDEVKALLREADLVVCHGGTGSIVTATREGCRVVAMPRSHELGEHYDNHQSEITRSFAARGLIGTARDEQELEREIARARLRQPMLATTDPSELADYLEELLRLWFCNMPGRSKQAV